MASGGGISGTAVAVATAGALLIYAGFRGIGPVEALREISEGRPGAIQSGDGPGLADGPRAEVGYAGWGGGTGGGRSAAIVQAAMAYRGDRYSQARRFQTGYSDCSSFVGKALKAAGARVPPGSTTASYYLSKDWQEIPLPQAAAGDIVVSATAATVGAHMVLVTGPGQAIGQQNPRSNVQTGPIEDLMKGSRYRYIAKRYTGPWSGGGSGSGVGQA